MNQIFISEDQISDGSVTITGDDFYHITHVLRMRRGEKLRACIPDDKAYLCEIEEITRDAVRAKILDLEGTYAELPGRITLFQGLPKSDKMEMIIQKAAELGAERIVPVSMTNCVMKLSGEKAEKKKKRWQAIALCAAQQAKRGVIPEVSGVMNLREAAQTASDLDLILIPYELADADTMAMTRRTFARVRPGMSAGVFIGPEGGFDPKEISYLKEHLGEKAAVISLGHRILRTETAALTMLSLLMYHFEIAPVSEA